MKAEWRQCGRANRDRAGLFVTQPPYFVQYTGDRLLSFLSRMQSLLARELTWVPGLSETIQLVGNSE